MVLCSDWLILWQGRTLFVVKYLVDLIVFSRSCPVGQQETILDMMWCIWPELPSYGRKTAQFVDLLGYFAIKTSQTSEKKVRVDKIIYWIQKSYGIQKDYIDHGYAFSDIAVSPTNIPSIGLIYNHYLYIIYCPIC